MRNDPHADHWKLDALKHLSHRKALCGTASSSTFESARAPGPHAKPGFICAIRVPQSRHNIIQWIRGMRPGAQSGACVRKTLESTLDSSRSALIPQRSAIPCTGRETIAEGIRTLEYFVQSSTT